jgi:hypothetical protein
MKKNTSTVIYAGEEVGLEVKKEEKLSIYCCFVARLQVQIVM